MKSAGLDLGREITDQTIIMPKDIVPVISDLRRFGDGDLEIPIVVAPVGKFNIEQVRKFR